VIIKGSNNRGMKKIMFLLMLIVSCYGCNKIENPFTKFKIGTFSGVKIVHYFGTNYDFMDTLTIKFESTEYSYLGLTSTHPLDCGSGNYIIKDNSIEFNDELVRTDNLTWDWILSGMFNLQITDDSIILNQNKPGLQISCRLKK
jgi:hypothetical protein